MISEQKQRTEDLPPIPAKDMQPAPNSGKCKGRTYMDAPCGQSRKAALFSNQNAAGRICYPSKCGQDLRPGKNKNTDPKNAQNSQKMKP